MTGIMQALFQPVLSLLSVAISDQFVGNFTTGAPCLSTYTLNSSGAATSNAFSIPGEWLVSGTNADFQCYMTPTSGTFFSGPTNVWTDLTASVAWVKRQGIVGIGQVVGTLQIREKISLVVVDTATITIEAERA